MPNRVLLPLLLPLTSLVAQEPGDAPVKVDFTKEVAPILVARCIECHGPKEQKGDLRLDARQYVFVEGEEDYWTVVPKDPGDSELVRRLALPVDDDDVMPAKGEPLTKAQQELIARWVREGADWPAAGDEWIAAELAAQVLPKITFELPELDAAAAAAVEQAAARLRELGAVVQQVAADTRAMDVNLSLLRGKVTDAELALLRPLAPVLVWLNAGRTAITDAGAEHLAALTELRRLNVAGTSLGDAGFAELGGLARLEHLNAYGTALGDAGLKELAGLPALRRVYVWQSAVTADGAAAARAQAPRLEVDTGDYVEQRLQQAQQEIEAREAKSKPVNDTCPVSGQPVDSAHFVDFEGRRVAFCCTKCKAKFEADPKAFADKLPKAAGEAPPGTPVNDTCPVSGQPVDAAQSVDFEGRRVAFCCAKCKAKFEADPKAFAGKLPKAK